MLRFTYPAKLTRDRKDGGYVVGFRDVPEAITQGETIEQALAEAEGALQAALEGRIGSFEGFLTDPGVMPSLQRCVGTLPASKQIDLALWILNECDLGDTDPHHHSQADCALTQMREDAREAEHHEARVLADGRSRSGLRL